MTKMPGNNKFKYSPADAQKWANFIIRTNASLVETANNFGIPPATIWRYIKNMTSEELRQKVSIILDAHRKNSPHKAISKKWENYYANQSK